jgi:hypothetical protein
MSVRREAANRVTIDCWYQRRLGTTGPECTWAARGECAGAQLAPTPARPTALIPQRGRRASSNPSCGEKGAKCVCTRRGKMRIVTIGVSGGRFRARRRFATPADSPRHDGTPYSHVRRERSGLYLSLKARFLSLRTEPLPVSVRNFVSALHAAPRLCASLSSHPRPRSRVRTATKKLRIVILAMVWHL